MPVKVLLLSHNNRSEYKSPILLRIEPSSRLFDRSKKTNSVKLERKLGSVPVIMFSAKPSRVKFL